MHPQTFGIGGNQPRRTTAGFQGKQLQARPQAQGLQANAAHPRADIPEHAPRGQGQLRKHLDAHLALGHQARPVVVLQIEAIVKAKQGQGLRWHGGGRFGQQHHQMQGIEVGRDGGSGIKPLHPLLGMAEPLTQPKPVGRLQAGGPQHPAHLGGTTTPGIGQHRKGRRAFLQRRRQGLGIAAMQAHPTGVLPGPAEAGKGQLQGAGGRVKAQLVGGEVLQQHPADAKPEGVAAGEQHRRAPHRQGLPHRANDLIRPVAS